MCGSSSRLFLKHDHVLQVQVLWLPCAPTEMPCLRRVAVEGDDFLATAESVLNCKNTVCYPLNWLGNRPKGLCVYEALDASESATWLQTSYHSNPSVVRIRPRIPQLSLRPVKECTYILKIPQVEARFRLKVVMLSRS